MEEVSVTRTHVAVKHCNTEQCLGSAVVSDRCVQSSMMNRPTQGRRSGLESGGDGLV